MNTQNVSSGCFFIISKSIKKKPNEMSVFSYENNRFKCIGRWKSS